MGMLTVGYKTFYKVRKLLPGNCKSVVKSVNKDLNLPPRNCLPVWSLFLQFPNLPPGDCQQGVQLVLLVPNLHPEDCLPGVHSFYTVSKPSSRGLLAGWGGGWLDCLKGVGVGCSLFIS